MSKSYPVEFKGTAFGDPARIASNATTQTSSRNSAANAKASAVTQASMKSSDQVVLSSKAKELAAASQASATQAASQSVGYKGTAFGDPV